MIGNRRHSREAAMSYLYQQELKVQSRTQRPLPFAQHFGVSEAYVSFFLKIVEGVEENKTSIDEYIEKAAEHWKLYRMSKIDLSILRMASFELIHTPETPHKVIIDEAVELAKEFGSQESGSFVNGILDKIAHQVRQIETPVPATAAIA